MISRAFRTLACVVALMASASPLAAQDATGRVSVEAVASVSVTSADAHPFIILDAVTTMRLSDGWDAVVRPWARRMPAGDWAAEMYQMQLRYTSSTRVPFRVDAGVISSPIGLSTLELRPDRNPTIGSPFYYFVPLPPIDGRYDGKRLITGGYPLGAVVSASGSTWDARAGITDASPTNAANVFEADRANRAPHAIVGAGWVPHAGLRLGAAVAHGQYRPRTQSASVVVTPAGDATTTTIEGEYAVGYTRVQAEWIADRFTTALTPAMAYGMNVMATRTLTPRWFAAARAVRASSPVLTGPNPGRRVATTAELSLGYRLTPAFTLRGGYQVSNSLYNPTRTHAAAVSVVWAQRWW